MDLTLGDWTGPSLLTILDLQEDLWLQRASVDDKQKKKGSEQKTRFDWIIN